MSGSYNQNSNSHINSKVFQLNNSRIRCLKLRHTAHLNHVYMLCTTRMSRRTPLSRLPRLVVSHLKEKDNAGTEIILSEGIKYSRLSYLFRSYITEDDLLHCAIKLFGRLNSLVSLRKTYQN